MRLINQTKNSILAEEVFFAETSLKRLKGLLGKKTFANGQALIIKPCNSVHTFFMRFAIDVIFVNKHHQIVQVIPGLKPFRMPRPYFRAAYVVELPVGVIKTSASLPGDILKLE